MTSATFNTAGLLARCSAQFYRRHPAQLALSILGIVLGVGIVTAVLITNNSASRAFALSTEALYGRSTHYVVAADGIADTRYAELRQAWPEVPMAPIVEGHVSVQDTVLTLVGLDPFAEASFERFGRASGDAANNNTLLTIGRALLENPAALLLAAPLAERLAVQTGDSFTIDTPSGALPVNSAGSFTTDNDAAIDGMVLTDIARAQVWLARDARIDRIELILGNDEQAAFADTLPSNLKLEPASTRRATMQAMTRGFQINLTAMSLLALVVGGFLIHNTMSFAVLQRRELFATLRISGVTAGQVLCNVLAEAAVISLIGATLGLVLGRVIAEALIALTTRTINDLYFVLHVQQVVTSPWLVVLGLLLGIGASLIAASASALDAAATSPVAARQRSLTEERTRKLLLPLALLGLLLMAAGAVLAMLPSLSLVIGFAALMLLIIGYGLSLPWMVYQLAYRLAPLIARLGTLLALALGSIERDISRTGLAIAALTVAVSATFGVDVMIGSFRSSVDNWLGRTLASDVYVSAPSTGGGGDALLDAELVTLAAATPGVAAVSSGRVIDIATDVGRMETLVLAPHTASADSFELVSGEPDTAWQTWLHQDAVLISEPLATKHELDVGMSLQLFTATDGDKMFKISGVFRDYASSHGKLLLARSTFDRHWHNNGISSLGIVVDTDADQANVLDALRDSFSRATSRPLQFRSGTSIHRESLAVFDRTFEVTRVLRWLTVGVAFIGIFSALLALHLERAREFAVLRASGATRAQIAGLVMLQSLFMGLFAGALALPLGLIMSSLLIHVINVRSFGWHMDAQLSSAPVLATCLLALTSATLAGVWPAFKVNRGGISERLRED